MSVVQKVGGRRGFNQTLMDELLRNYKLIVSPHSFTSS